MQKPQEIETDTPRDLSPKADARERPGRMERSDLEALLEELAEIIESEGGVLTP